MTKFKNKYRIESNRLQDFDYSSEGAYFLTFNTKDRINTFGEIKNEKLIETEQAKICLKELLDIPNHYPNCILDEFIIMPDHIHMILILQKNVQPIHESAQRSAHRESAQGVQTVHEPSQHEPSLTKTIHESSLQQQNRRQMTIFKIIGRFKMRTAKLINEYQNTSGQPFWQSRFHDRIIRDERELENVRRYIRNNPKKDTKTIGGGGGGGGVKPIHESAQQSAQRSARQESAQGGVQTVHEPSQHEPSQQQQILCIPTQKLFQKEKWNGLKTTDLEYYYQLILENSEFCPRNELEQDPNYKQIIPQVILKYQDKYFLHRQASANETRLNKLCPLPLGGHVEEFDQNPNNDIIQTALIRELNEEADVKATIIKKDFIGIVYIEDENPVNHVHIGLMYLFELDSDKVVMKEEGLETIGWIDTNYLQTHINELTYWSREYVKLIL